MGRQQTTILRRLRQGPVRNTELTRIALRYSARIAELREAGYEIETRSLGDRGVFEYALVGEKVGH